MKSLTNDVNDNGTSINNSNDVNNTDNYIDNNDNSDNNQTSFIHIKDKNTENKEINSLMKNNDDEVTQKNNDIIYSKFEDLKNEIDEKDEKKTIKKRSFISSWLLKNIELLTMRAFFVLFKYKNLMMKIINNKKTNVGEHIYNFFKAFSSSFFSLSSVRFVCGISFISLLNKVFQFLFNKLDKLIFNSSKNNNKRDRNAAGNDNNESSSDGSKSVIIKCLSIFFASLISILISEKSEITNYLILSIIVRIFHNVVSNYFKECNILQYDNKIYYFFLWSVPAMLWSLIMYWHPGFSSIVKPVESYMNLIGTESVELNTMRKVTKIV